PSEVDLEGGRPRQPIDASPVSGNWDRSGGAAEDARRWRDRKQGRMQIGPKTYDGSGELPRARNYKRCSKSPVSGGASKLSMNEVELSTSRRLVPGRRYSLR